MTEEGPTPRGATPPEAAGPPGLTRRQGVYLMRYALGRLVIERIRLVFLTKWVLAGLGGLLILVAFLAGNGSGGEPGGGPGPDVLRILGVALLVVFGLAWLVQTALCAVVRRLAVPRRYRPAVGALEAAAADWWPRLAAELRRVGLPAGPFRVVGLARRLVLRQLRPGEREALRELRIGNVFPGADLRRAQRLFDEADPTP